MNSLLNGMKDNYNYGLTENGGVKHITTRSALLDMFGMGGSMRNRSNDDVITMFKKAYKENPTYALKCLFYLRNARGGAGERRFFRVVIKWLADYDSDAALRNLEYIPQFGRWDDLYALVGTSCEDAAFNLLNAQIKLDSECKTPSLAAKWCKSINTSSAESRELGRLTCKHFGMTEREYRKTLSAIRKKINIVEALMSQNRWDEIEFDKIPSRAGLLYKNAFARNEITKARYEAFMKNKDTKVHAGVLNPVDIAGQIFKYGMWSKPSDIERKAWDKYWECLPDYYGGKEEPGIAIVDVSGSMTGTPMDAAVAMGAYIAERGKGPFQNHFITFSDRPALVEFEGADLFDKFQRARLADWGGSTNIEAVFNLLLKTAIQNHVSSNDMPKTIYIFSDMEFNRCVVTNSRDYRHYDRLNENGINTVIEQQMAKWRNYGYKAPRVIFWNLNACSENIPAIGEGFSYVSGFSMSAIEAVLSGKDGYSLMMEMLDKPEYNCIH